MTAPRRLLQVLSGGCVCYLPFWEGTGTFTEDVTPNKNHGVITNPLWVNGVIGKALEFDGLGNNIVTLPNSTSLDLSGSAMSISAWLYSRSGTYALMAVAKEDGGAQRAYYFGMNNATQFKVALWTSSGRVDALSPNTFQLNVWQHVVFTYNGAQMIVYLNGVAGTPAGQTGTILSFPTVNTTIGNRIVGGYPWDGFICECRFFNRALSPTEVWQDYYTCARLNY